jgi:hypothetical protein
MNGFHRIHDIHRDEPKNYSVIAAHYDVNQLSFFSFFFNNFKTRGAEIGKILPHSVKTSVNLFSKF